MQHNIIRHENNTMHSGLPAKLWWLVGKLEQRPNQGLYALAQRDCKGKTQKRVDSMEIGAWCYNIFDNPISVTFLLFILSY